MEVLGHKPYNRTFNLHFVLTEEYCGTGAWSNCYQKDQRGCIQQLTEADAELHTIRQSWAIHVEEGLGEAENSGTQQEHWLQYQLTGYNGSSQITELAVVQHRSSVHTV